MKFALAIRSIQLKASLYVKINWARIAELKNKMANDLTCYISELKERKYKKN